MRRTLAALVLALILLFGSFACAEGEPEIFSYDFDIRFHLNTEVFSFREREEMQGWADLMDLLEFMEAEDADSCTLLAGKDYSDEQMAALVERIEEVYDDLEIDAQRGEQPLYPLVFSVE